MGRSGSSRAMNPVERAQRATEILGEEVANCVSARLVQKGFELVQDPPATKFYNPLWARAWTLKLDGVRLAMMNVNAHFWGVMLSVRTETGEFAHTFKLYKTDSPRKVSCLLVLWLKQAQIRQVMIG